MRHDFVFVIGGTGGKRRWFGYAQARLRSSPATACRLTAENGLIATRTDNTLAFHNRTSGNGFPEQRWIDDGNAMIGK